MESNAIWCVFNNDDSKYTHECSRYPIDKFENAMKEASINNNLSLLTSDFRDTFPDFSEECFVHVESYIFRTTTINKILHTYTTSEKIVDHLIDNGIILPKEFVAPLSFMLGNCNVLPNDNVIKYNWPVIIHLIKRIIDDPLGHHELLYYNDLKNYYDENIVDTAIRDENTALNYLRHDIESRIGKKLNNHQMHLMIRQFQEMFIVNLQNTFVPLHK